MVPINRSTSVRETARRTILAYIAGELEQTGSHQFNGLGLICWLRSRAPEIFLADSVYSTNE
jgi:hypothetical protein